MNEKIAGLATMSFGAMLEFLNQPGGGMLVGFGIACIVFDRFCQRCRKEEGDK